MALAVRLRRQVNARAYNADGTLRSDYITYDSRNDDALVNRLCQALLAGNTIKNSCKLSGVDVSDFYRWMRDGVDAPEDSVPRTFFLRASAAMAEAEHRNVMLIQKAATRSWQAAAWFLERRNPEAYGRRERVEVANADGEVFVTGTASDQVLNDEEKLAALRGVLKRRPELHFSIPDEVVEVAREG